MRPHIVKSEQLRLSTWARRGGCTRPDLGWSCERAFREGQLPASPGVAQEKSVIDKENSHFAAFNPTYILGHVDCVHAPFAALDLGWTDQRVAESLSGSFT